MSHSLNIAECEGSDGANASDSITYPQDINKWRFVEVYGTYFRPCLLDMAQTITRLELWDWFKNENPPGDSGYMYWGHSNVTKISDGLADNQHSGATFGYCMRQMQAIAKQGFENWNRSLATEG